MSKNRKLPGGSVLNSSLLSIEDKSKVSAFNQRFNNFGLKTGIINAVHEVGDKTNISKIGPEYDVLVIEQEGNKGISGIQYKNCITTDTFGNIADFFEVRYRGQSKAEKNSTRDPAKQNGAYVLILCIDGASEKGIIIGALKHAKREESLDKGLHLHGEYNGLNIKVDKDGAFKVEFKGPRDDDGKYTNKTAGGSYAEINKDGQIELNTGNDDYVRIDKKNKDIGIKAGQHIGATAAKNVGLNAGENINLKAGKDFAFTAGGKASISATSTFDIKADGAFSLKAASVDVMADGSYKVTAPQIALDGLTSVGGLGGTPALLQLTKFQGTGNLGAPVISEAIGPFSSKVFISV